MDSNRHHEGTEQTLGAHPTPYTEMSLKELQVTVDSEILADTVADILSLPVEKRSAAIADFAEIDPVLGQRLSIAVSFAIS